MRREYSNALKKEFGRQIREMVPKFSEWKHKSYYIWPGERVYYWCASPKLYCFIIMSPNPKGYDEFMVELAWSRLGRFPELSMRPSGEATSDRAEFQNDEFSVTLSSVCPDKNVCWQINAVDFLDRQEREAYILNQTIPISAADALLVVRPVVSSAIEFICNFGVPYFEELMG